jgi:putative ABC transport system permease protein
MDSVIDIGWLQLGLFSLVILIPLYISSHYRLFLGKDIVIALIRMGVQLFLVGLYLEYLFNLNNILVNTIWLILIVFIGASSILSRAQLPHTRIILPLFIALLQGLVPVLFILCVFVVKPIPLYNAQYMIPIAGMLMGNSLSGNIIVLQNLFTAFEERKDEYEAAISLGASPRYAARPFIKSAMQKASAPVLASMTTIGLVTLPGMMTGQILGGSSPIIAIKYQFIIMVAIFVVLNLSMALSIEYIFKVIVNKEGRILVQFKSKN